MNDTVFVFPEFKFRYNISNFTNSEEKNSIIGDDIAFFSNKTNLNKKYIEKSELTIHLEDFLEFLLDKNIQIDLPSQVQVKYFDFDRLEQLKYQLLHNDNSLVQYFKGAVELGELKEMNAQNFQKISNQLSKVKFDSSEAGMFCSWLKGVVDINENQNLNQKAFNLNLAHEGKY